MITNVSYDHFGHIPSKTNNTLIYVLDCQIKVMRSGLFYKTKAIDSANIAKHLLLLEKALEVFK